MRADKRFITISEAPASALAHVVLIAIPNLIDQLSGFKRFSTLTNGSPVKLVANPNLPS
jgi:hypothetical protein